MAARLEALALAVEDDLAGLDALEEVRRLTGASSHTTALKEQVGRSANEWPVAPLDETQARELLPLVEEGDGQP